VVGGKAYTASQVRTTSRLWDKGVLTDMPHPGVNRLMPHPGVNRLMPHPVVISSVTFIS